MFFVNNCSLLKLSEEAFDEKGNFTIRRRYLNDSARNYTRFVYVIVQSGYRRYVDENAWLIHLFQLEFLTQLQISALPVLFD